MPEGIRVRGSTSDPRCPFCREDLGPLARFTCPGCEVTYHEACAQELPRCATLGCERRLRVAPVPVAAPVACRACAEALEGSPQRTCHYCSLAYHASCAESLEACLECTSRMSGPEGSVSADLRELDLAMENLVGFVALLSCTLGISLAIYLSLRLSAREAQRYFVLLIAAPCLLVGLMTGAAMGLRAAWRRRRRKREAPPR